MSQHKELHRQRADETRCHARDIISEFATRLSRDGYSYQYNADRTGLNRIGGTDLQLTTEVATKWDPIVRAFVPDGQTMTVRLIGPRPARAKLYARNTKGKREWRLGFWQYLKQQIGRAAGAEKRRKQPTIMQAAEQRTLAVAHAFGPRAKYNCGQARIDMPGGAVVYVSGERDHSVHIEHLSERQLRAVLSAIAATTEPGE